MIAIFLKGFKIFVFAAFFFHLGGIKNENPTYTWSETIQSASGKVFEICEGFEFCRNLNQTAVQNDKEAKA